MKLLRTNSEISTLFAGQLCRKITQYAITIAIAFALVFSFCTPALADVRKNDIVMGQSMSDRGLKATFCPSVDRKSTRLNSSHRT